MGRIIRIAQVAFAILIGVILTIATNGEAVARTSKHWYAHRHFQGHATAGSERRVVNSRQLAMQQPADLQPMRYYGGPKSPMWRGVSADQEQASAKPAHTVSQQATSLAPMRYYGGPKSPMWRGPS